jgi:hypothetical protein
MEEKNYHEKVDTMHFSLIFLPFLKVNDPMPMYSECSRSNGHQVSKRRALAYPVGSGRAEQLWSKGLKKTKLTTI